MDGWMDGRVGKSSYSYDVFHMNARGIIMKVVGILSMDGVGRED